MQARVLLSLLLLAATGKALANYRRLDVEGRGRMALVRALAVAILVLVLVLPAWVRPGRERERPRIVWLVDASASMALPAGPGRPSRFAHAMEAQRALAGALGGAFEHQLLGFSTGLAATGPGPEPPTGPATDLDAALRGALATAGERTRAVFLVSDGRQTRGSSPLAAARAAPFAIHAVGIGSTEPTSRWVAALELGVPEEGFKGGRVPVTAQVRTRGIPAGISVEVVLEADGEPVARTSAPGGFETTGVVFDWTPDRGGLTPLRVVVRAPAGFEDGAPGDEVAPSAILLRERPAGVLFLQGRPSPDAGFVRRVLAADPRLVVVDAPAHPGEKALVLPPADSPGSLEQAALVVVGGFSAAAFPAPTQEALAAFVTQRGGALLLVGMGAREWKDLQGTPLAPLLPIDPGAEAQALEKRLPVRLAAGDAHPVTRVIEHLQANRQAWERLPPILPGAAAPALAGAVVWLDFPYYPRPLALAAGRAVKKGLVAVINSTETFQWALLPAAHGDPETVHARFFANLASWLADPARRGGEKIRLSRLRWAPGEPVRIFWDGPADAAPPPELSVVPQGAGGGAPLRVSLEAREPGHAVGELPAPAAGAWTVQGSGGAEPAALVVLEPREEVLAKEPDHELLKAVAEASGGSYLPWGENGLTGLGLPPVDPTPVERDRSAGVYWLDEPLVLAASLLLFCLEWWMRRRRNLA